MSPIKFKTHMKAHEDEKQAKFATDGTAQIKHKAQAIIGFLHAPTEQFACPFCLGLHMLRRYFISTKKGIHQGLGQCPECHNKFRFRTLTNITTAKQYADFAYPYSSAGFWQKVPWDKWKTRLNRIGWSEAFWRRYHQLKGEDAGTEKPDTEQKEQEDIDWEEYEKSFKDGEK